MLRFGAVFDRFGGVFDHFWRRFRLLLAHFLMVFGSFLIVFGSFKGPFNRCRIGHLAPDAISRSWLWSLKHAKPLLLRHFSLSLTIIQVEASGVPPKRSKTTPFSIVSAPFSIVSAPIRSIRIQMLQSSTIHTPWVNYLPLKACVAIIFQEGR